MGAEKNLEKRVQDCSRKFKILAIRARPLFQNLSLEPSHAEKKRRRKTDFSKARIKCVGKSLGIFNEVTKSFGSQFFQWNHAIKKFPLNSHLNHKLSRKRPIHLTRNQVFHKVS